MTWKSFKEFVDMKRAGKKDAIMRNYKLAIRGVSATAIRKAVGRMDNEVYRAASPSFLVRMIGSRLSACGVPEIEPFLLEAWICEWYVWDRIRTGEIRQWAYNRRTGNA